MTTESAMWQWFKTNTKGAFLERVENLVATGTPDVDGCMDGVAFKIELKRCPSRNDKMVRVSFRNAQMPWHRKFWSHGGLCFVLLQVGSAQKAQRYLIKGCDLNDSIFKMRLQGDRKADYEVSEEELADVSLCDPSASAQQILEAIYSVGS